MNNRTKWDKDMILVEIKRLYAEGMPLNASYIMSNNSKLYGAARKYYDSWKVAIENAGLDYTVINLRSAENKWTEDKIVEEIKKLYEQNVPLNSDYIQKNHTKLHSASQRYFSSWGDAVDKAGYNYDEIKGIKWTEETIKDEILRLNEENVVLCSSQMQETNMDLFQAGCRIYGSWKNAVNSSGLSYDDFRKQKEWNKETVLSEIRSFINENNNASAGLVSKKNGALYQAARRNFRGLRWAEIVNLAINERK